MHRAQFGNFEKILYFAKNLIAAWVSENLSSIVQSLKAIKYGKQSHQKNSAFEQLDW